MALNCNAMYGMIPINAINVARAPTARDLSYLAEIKSAILVMW